MENFVNLRNLAITATLAILVVYESVHAQSSPEQATITTVTDGSENQPIQEQVAAPLPNSNEFAVAESNEEGAPSLQQQFDSMKAELDGLKKRLDKSAIGNWNNDGLTFVSSNGNFKTHIGGLAQLDYVGFPGVASGITGIPGGAGTEQSVEFRRLRLRAEGTMYQNIDWVSEFDFALALQNTDQLAAAAQNLGLRSFPTGVGQQAGNTINVIQPTTVFITIKDLPIVGNMRIGNQQDWLSLEHIESARFQDFMERSPIMDAFSGANNNGYAPGISFFNTTENKRLALQYGAYKNNVYDSGFTYNIGNAFMYGGRICGTPYYDEESNGRYLIHTAIGSEYRQFNTDVAAGTSFDNVRVRSRGVLRNAASTLDPNFADTGNFYATGQTVLNPEFAMVWGPWLFQAEYSQSWFYGVKPAKTFPRNWERCRCMAVMQNYFIS